MNVDQLNEWISNYGKAWESLDPNTVMTLIDRNDLTYYESTFNEPLHDWSTVNQLWQIVPNNQKDVKFWHEILLANGNEVLAHVKVSRTMVPSGEHQNIDAAFLFKLNDNGLCTYFRTGECLPRIS